MLPSAYPNPSSPPASAPRPAPPPDAGQGAAPVVLRDYLAKNYQRLHHRLTRHLSCADLASDCLHDAWLRLGETTVSEAVQNPEAYIYRTACNLAMDYLRRNRPWRQAGEPESDLELLTDHAPGPEAIVEARAGVDALERAIEILPRRHRSVLVALRLEERTRQEVADRHRISLRKVDTMLRQALDHCAAAAGRAVLVGVSAPRRGLPRRWLERAAGTCAL